MDEEFPELPDEVPQTPIGPENEINFDTPEVPTDAEPLSDIEGEDADDDNSLDDITEATRSLVEDEMDEGTGVDEMEDEQAAAGLQAQVDSLRRLIVQPNELPFVFIGEITASSGLWKEKIVQNGTNPASTVGTIVDFGTPGVDGRGWTDTTNTVAKLIFMNDAQFPILQQQDANNSYFPVSMAGGSMYRVYLTLAGGSTSSSNGTVLPTANYSVFWNAAKTILAFPTPLTPARDMYVDILTTATAGMYSQTGTAGWLHIAHEVKAITNSTCG